MSTEQTSRIAALNLASNLVANYARSGDEKHPLTMANILERLRPQTADWPRRVGTSLFLHDPDHGIHWFDKPPQLFGWLQATTGKVDWSGGGRYVSRAELHSELERTATQYEAIADLPHQPRLDGHYYTCGQVAAGDGATLQKLLERFSPATGADYDLLKTAFLTPGWGGPYGCRPCYVITSDTGRGAGKTTVVKMIGDLWGGILSFSDKEDINKIKTRLLSPDALPRRVALLDNVKSHRFSWGELEHLITASTIGGHRMYQGEATRPNTLTWFITLNGASLSTDMAQRAIIVKLDRPERSATWEDDTRQFIADHRDQLIADIVGELQRPGEWLKSFSRWATWERDVLNCTAEPGEAQSTIADRQLAVDVEADEAETIEDYFSDQVGRLGYADDATVFVPSKVAVEWFCQATNERKNSVAVGRILSQFIDEGRIKSLHKTGRSYGRGFQWASTGADTSSMKTDIETRIRASQS
jgi:hypothetical protein